MMKPTVFSLLFAACLQPGLTSPAAASEEIPEDDIISCYTLIQEYPDYKKEKVSDTIIKHADKTEQCPQLPYKIYKGKAYKWKSPQTGSKNLHYLCIKDMRKKNRFSLVLLTGAQTKILNNPYLGNTVCDRLNILLNAPQWVTFAE